MDERKKGLLIGFAKTGIPLPVVNYEKLVRYQNNKYGTTAEFLHGEENEAGGIEIILSGGTRNGS